MADAQATMTEAQVDDQPVTQTRLTQRRGRAPTEATEHFIGPEQPNWDQKTWQCIHCKYSWAWGKSGQGSKMDAHLTGDCSHLKGVTIKECKKVPAGVKMRISGKKPAPAPATAPASAITVHFPPAPSASAFADAGDDQTAVAGRIHPGQWGAITLQQSADQLPPVLPPPSTYSNAAVKQNELKKKVDRLFYYNTATAPAGRKTYFKILVF